MAQAERRLAFVDADAEQLELERRLEVAQRRSGVDDRTPNRVCRTPANVLLSLPN